MRVRITIIVSNEGHVEFLKVTPHCHDDCQQDNDPLSCIVEILFMIVDLSNDSSKARVRKLRHILIEQIGNC